MNYIFWCLTFVALLYSALGYSSTFYTDNDLGQTIPVGMGKRQKKELQQGILELMGLYSKPKRHSKEEAVQSASEFMRKLYQTLTDGDSTLKDGEEDDSHFRVSGNVNASALGLDPARVEGCDVIVSFVNKAKQVPHLRHEKDRTFYFDFSEISVGEQVKGAELRLYKEVTRGNKYPGSFTITLYRIKQGKDPEDKILSEESKRVIDWDTEGWLTLDATRAAEDWTFFPYSNMGLFLKVTDSYGNEYSPREIGLVDRRGAPNKIPFLVGYMRMSEELISRRTRSLHNRYFGSGAPEAVSYNPNPYTLHSRHKRSSFPPYVSNTDCQRHHLYINFTELGLDKKFLISPEGYTAFYCAGQCTFPMGIHLNATNHAIVQTLVHLMKPTHVPNPCCAPTKFSAITVLYHENNASVVIRNLMGMIVRACGCH